MAPRPQFGPNTKSREHRTSRQSPPIRPIAERVVLAWCRRGLHRQPGRGWPCSNAAARDRDTRNVIVRRRCLRASGLPRSRSPGHRLRGDHDGRSSHPGANRSCGARQPTPRVAAPSDPAADGAHPRRRDDDLSSTTALARLPPDASSGSPQQSGPPQRVEARSPSTSSGGRARFSNVLQPLGASPNSDSGSSVFPRSFRRLGPCPSPAVSCRFADGR